MDRKSAFATGIARLEARLGRKATRLLEEALAILRSQELARLREAALSGRFAEVRVGRRRIVFEPGFPPNRYGMTLARERGFLLGPRAFSSHDELARTVLQELFRLEHGEAGRDVDARRALSRTLSARRFSERAFALGRRAGLW